MEDERNLDGVPRVASFKTVAEFKAHLATLPIPLDCDGELLPPTESPLARPITVYGRTVGNRFATHPMEGWDGTLDGKPSNLVLRRWRHFGVSGAKLIWGGEAVAVRHDGRANPHQLLIDEATVPALARLREALVAEHEAACGAGAASDLVIGLQLTHSGRYSRPYDWDRPGPASRLRKTLWLVWPPAK